MENSDLILWGLGVAISVMLAFLAVKRIRKSRNQSVKADRGATVIQSGRDTSIK